MSSTNAMEHREAVYLYDYVRVRNDYEGVVLGIEPTIDEALVYEIRENGEPTDRIHEEPTDDIQQHNQGRCHG